MERLLRRLREEGFTISIWDYSRIAGIHVLRRHWRRGELRVVLRACIVRSAEGAETFERVFEEVYGGPDPDVLVFPADREGQGGGTLRDEDERSAADQESGGPGAGKGRSARDPKPSIAVPEDQKPKAVVGFLADSVVAAIGIIQRSIAGKGDVVKIGGALVATIPLGMFISMTPAPNLPDREQTVDFDALLYGLAAACGIMAAAAVFIDGWLQATAMRRDRWKAAAEGKGETEEVADTATGFRIGLVGVQAPPRRLSPRRARAIAEQFAYCDAEKDWRQMDVPLTIRQRVGDPARDLTISFVRRRCLPGVVVVTDRAGPGPIWNTLAQETTALLAQRGLQVTALDIDGSFHRRARDGSMVRVPEVQRLLANREDEHPSVTLLFSDGIRMIRLDADVIVALKQTGPVLWFDYRDRHLWSPHGPFIPTMAGIAAWEACDEHLEAALRSVYSPGNASGRWKRPRGTAGAPGPGGDVRTHALRILGSAVDWATDCAVLQPLSLGLVWRIRERLHPQVPWMAFSRFLALPGSTLGREGLRFDPGIRQWLRQRFSLTRPPEEQDTLTDILSKAFEEARPDAPVRSFAAAAWEWGKLQAEVLTRPDEAIPRIDAIRRENIVDAGPVTEFLRNIEPDARALIGAGGRRRPAAIPLSRPPLSVAARRVLSALVTEPLPLAPDLWRVGGLQFRDHIETDATPYRTAFCAGGTLFAHVSPATLEATDALACSDLENGEEHKVALYKPAIGSSPVFSGTDGGERILFLAGATLAPRLAAVTSRGRVVVVDLPRGTGPGGRSRLQRSRPERPVTASWTLEPRRRSADGLIGGVCLTASGRHVAVAHGSALEVAVLGDVRPDIDEPSVRSIEGNQAVGALACAGRHEGFILGTPDGQLRFIDAGRPQALTARYIQVPGGLSDGITAIGVDPSADVFPVDEEALSMSFDSEPVAWKGGVMAIATDRGDLHVFGRRARNDIIERRVRLGWAATVVEVFADGGVVAVAGPQGRFDMIDVDLAISALDPGFDDDRRIALADRDVLAVSDEGRRMATVDRHAELPRVEVHSLEFSRNPEAEPEPQAVPA